MSTVETHQEKMEQAAILHRRMADLAWPIFENMDKSDENFPPPERFREAAEGFVALWQENPALVTEEYFGPIHWLLESSVRAAIKLHWMKGTSMGPDSQDDFDLELRVRQCVAFLLLHVVQIQQTKLRGKNDQITAAQQDIGQQALDMVRREDPGGRNEYTIG